MRAIILLVTLLLSTPLFALEKVSIQLKWHHQFQFAGYYAAIEQGYYRDEGLDVTLKDRDPALNNIGQVIKGESQYGIGDSALLVYQAQKKPIVIVAPIFQHSPNVLISLESSGIDSPAKLVGKRISFYPNDADGLAILAMLHEAGVTKKGFKRTLTHFDVTELIDNKVDVAHGYMTNEPYLYWQKGIAVNIINPQNFGVDFYGDMLFTTQDELNHHPKRVAAMKRATIKGWEYAISHKEEMIRLIQTKYHGGQTTDKLLYEADGIIAAIAPYSVPVGTLNQGRIDFIQNILRRHGLTDSNVPLEHYIYRDAQEVRLALMEYINLDRIVYIGGILLVILMILAYYTRQLRNREQELSALSKSLNQAQQIAHLGNWEWDIKQSTLWWSDEIYRIFGLEPQAFRATYDAFLQRVHPDDREMVQEAVNHALNDDTEYHCVHRIILPDGILRYVLEEGVVLRDEHHKPIKMIGTVHDITERKKVEILLAEKEGSLQTLLNSVAEGIYGVDVHGYCTFVNRSFLRILGFDHEDEVLGKHIHELIHHSHEDGSVYPSHECRMYKANQTHQASHVDDEVFWRRDGTSVAVEYWSYPMLENGEFVGAVATFLDVTERIAAREELIKAKESAEASTRAKSEFLAAMSHEIRTPMNGVLGMLSLLERSKLDTAQHHHVHIATSSATSLLGLINDILDFSKIEAGKMDLEKVEFNLRDEIEEFVESISFKAREKGLELILNMTKLDHPNIISDPGRLRQIMTNLVGNAIKFTGSGHVIMDVSLNETQNGHGHLHIDITDSGIGIASDKIETLFEAFAQADGSTTRKYGGTGLGLSIVKRLCELMNGSISVTSILGEGSTFSIDFEIELGDRTTIAIRDKSQVSQMTTDIQERAILWPVNTRILLVEDNSTNQIVAQGMLETMGLYADIAANGLEAIASIRLATDTLPYSIVLMDCQMPEMDGYDATRAVRSGEAGESNKTIPIVAMTANAMAGDREKCMIAGMDDYIAKPIHIVTLKATLMKWLLDKEMPEVKVAQGEVPLVSELVLWDEQEALSRMGGNGELLNRILASFLLESQKALSALKSAIDEARLKDAQLHAHSLKGSAGNVSALRLQAITKRLEDAASSQELSLLQEGYKQCDTTLRATLELLEEHLMKVTKQVTRKKRLDPLDMAIKLNMLKQEIENGTFIDTDGLGIFGETTDESFNDKLHALKGYIDQFETQKALDVIENVLKEL